MQPQDNNIHNGEPDHSSAFKRATDYIRANKIEGIGVTSSLLLGTTALTTGLLTSVIASGPAAATLLLGASLFGLITTSDAMVDNFKAIGHKLNIPGIILGLAMGAMTSAPELSSTLVAIKNNVADLAVGNIVGSNIANILLILGTAAVLGGVGKANGLSWKFNTLSVLGLTAGFGAMLAFNAFNPITCGLMGLGLIGFLAGNYKASKDDGTDNEEDPETVTDKLPGLINGLWASAATAGLIMSANLLVESATSLATMIGMKEAIIGALVVAVGTSLPELMVTIQASMKKNADMILGNVMGSNAFNMLVVGGALAWTGTNISNDFNLSSSLGLLNLGAFAGSAILMGGLLLAQNGKLKVWQGALALAAYLGFTAGSIKLNEAPAEVPAVTESVEEVITNDIKPTPPENLTFLPAPQIN